MTPKRKEEIRRYLGGWARNEDHPWTIPDMCSELLAALDEAEEESATYRQERDEVTVNAKRYHDELLLARDVVEAVKAVKAAAGFSAEVTRLHTRVTEALKRHDKGTKP